MKEYVLVLVKPDGMVKALAGEVLNRFSLGGLDLAAAKVVRPSRELAEKHYCHIRGTPFYDGVIDYLLGRYHAGQGVLALVYSGEDAVRHGREIAGATNPEEAAPTTIRGSLGRITTRGIYENVVHVSSSRQDAAREILLWFGPDETFSREVLAQERGK